jgi:hypothetical protein
MLLVDASPGQQLLRDQQPAGRRCPLWQWRRGLSTRCGGEYVMIYFGMAKPVRAPHIGLARPADASEHPARTGPTEAVK